jgi:hypothetical protein
LGKKRKHNPDWAEAKKLCRLNAEEIAMAQALDFTPRNLIKSIPHGPNSWKLPVKLWVRQLYRQRFDLDIWEIELANSRQAADYLGFVDFSEIEESYERFLRAERELRQPVAPDVD